MKKILTAVFAVALLATMAHDAIGAAFPNQPAVAIGADQQQVKEVGYRQKDLINLLKALRNQVHGITANGGADLSVGTTVAKVRTNSIINYEINGKMYGKASTDDFCTIPVGTALTTTTASYFRFEIDVAGACSVVQGTVAAVASGTVNGAVSVPPRTVDANGVGKATLGVLLVGGQAFTPGTTTTLASGTVVYTNGDPDLINLLDN